MDQGVCGTVISAVCRGKTGALAQSGTNYEVARTTALQAGAEARRRREDQGTPKRLAANLLFFEAFSTKRRRDPLYPVRCPRCQAGIWLMSKSHHTCIESALDEDCAGFPFGGTFGLPLAHETPEPTTEGLCASTEHSVTADRLVSSDEHGPTSSKHQTEAEMAAKRVEILRSQYNEVNEEELTALRRRFIPDDEEWAKRYDSLGVIPKGRTKSVANKDRLSKQRSKEAKRTARPAQVVPSSGTKRTFEDLQIHHLQREQVPFKTGKRKGFSHPMQLLVDPSTKTWALPLLRCSGAALGLLAAKAFVFLDARESKLLMEAGVEPSDVGWILWPLAEEEDAEFDLKKKQCVQRYLDCQAKELAYLARCGLENVFLPLTEEELPEGIQKVTSSKVCSN